MHVEEGRGGKETLVTEVPYQVLRSSITERAAAAVKGGLIKDVAVDQRCVRPQARDSHRNRARKGANADVVMNQLYQYTPLQSTSII
ncbi:MAG: hypothetical protein R3E58_17065 [Phycisphaerae bacterium]